MKTTIELPEALLREAKAMAARRRTTLRAILIHALEREVRFGGAPAPAAFVVDADGVPHLPARGVTVTSELVSRLLDEEAA